jgi:hypothetical protein
MLSSGLRELPIISNDQTVLGLVTESALASVYLRGAARAEDEASSMRTVPSNDDSRL